MVLVDYSGDYKASTTLTVQYSNPLVDHEDLIDGVPASLVPSGATNEYAQCPYHGKAAAAGATISSVAKALGWSDEVWDLSGAVPVLK